MGNGREEGQKGGMLEPIVMSCRFSSLPVIEHPGMASIAFGYISQSSQLYSSSTREDSNEGLTRFTGVRGGKITNRAN